MDLHLKNSLCSNDRLVYEKDVKSQNSWLIYGFIKKEYKCLTEDELLGYWKSVTLPKEPFFKQDAIVNEFVSDDKLTMISNEELKDYIRYHLRNNTEICYETKKENYC